MNALRLALILAAFVVLLLLALYNTGPVQLRFLDLPPAESPLAFVVFAAFAIGVACGLAAGAMRASRLKRQLRMLRREPRAGRHVSYPVAPDAVLGDEPPSGRQGA